MRWFWALFAISVCSSGCSTVPSLEEASGASEPQVLIQDVVKGVKCEIAEAFEDELNDESYLWLQAWTAKVDLTLQINVQAGITPGCSYTQYYSTGKTPGGYTNYTYNAAGALTSQSVAALP